MAKTTILYVEDEEYDVLFMRRAFSKAASQHGLEIATDGQKAIDFLSDCTQPPPGLVLLDLNLPLISGFEVLKWIRQQPSLRQLPVLIFSSSARPEDRSKATELGANEYIQKPGSALDFEMIVKDLEVRWLSKGAECAKAGVAQGG
jgi:CheY-like chemotaxis protein